ncbi:NFACT RNA binding domain-containing protein [Fluviispira multicolorata]|uniref:NFACT RNA binding domain-containing protein n=1 Tax=Fluviispira multicolorata TaxID=2654512 RepID=UPI001375F038|nr:NFACT RNA binding domain-containing protein [Fluviispira multicolorata]
MKDTEFSQELRTGIAQLAIWTRKFAQPLHRIMNASLQKITASEQGHIILSVYKPGDDRSAILLSMKKGESGISTTRLKPTTLKQPNSIVQISRKYIQGRKVCSAYATISPICIIIELSDANKQIENFQEINEGPNCLILDLDAKPPRIILAKKYLSTPSRYKEQYGINFSPSDSFFESWCEWSEDCTKTKKRACFEYPLIAYCPLPQIEQNKDSQNIEVLHTEFSEIKLKSNPYPLQLNTALEILPTHIRRSAKTKLQFLSRRLIRQKADMPDEKEILRLQKQSEGFKTHLYLWPKDSVKWYVPPQFIQEFGLPAFYTLKKGEKPGDLLNKIHHEIDILKRRKQELSARIIESKTSEYDFQKLIIESAEELKSAIDNYKEKHFHLQTDLKKFEKYSLDYVLIKEDLPLLSRLCGMLDISMTESEQAQKIKEEKEKRFPFKEFTASTGEFIRVARSAEDGDKMIKLMPSHHTWIHVLTGEGSHVWLEKPKGEKPSLQAVREAAILAVHHSKHSRAQNTDVQISTRADIEKRKNLPPGKVLVRRCETLLIKYDNTELHKITDNNNLKNKRN